MKAENIHISENLKPNFAGTIKNNVRMRTAISHALSSDKETATQFFNTLNLIRNDGSKKILKIDKIINKNYLECIYTSYGKIKFLGGSDDYVLNVIAIGKKLFGKSELSQPVKNLNKAIKINNDMIKYQQKLSDAQNNLCGMFIANRSK